VDSGKQERIQRLGEGMDVGRSIFCSPEPDVPVQEDADPFRVIGSNAERTVEGSHCRSGAWKAITKLYRRPNAQGVEKNEREQNGDRPQQIAARRDFLGGWAIHGWFAVIPHGFSLLLN